ncbi:MAG: glycine dehydrogenase subunit 1 [Actinomycetota bacterium]|jgi:glycine dehydrogenase subunit 1|nr:glycine dehydrogenase subunit 1 [Actinomycetota bacterium]
MDFLPHTPEDDQAMLEAIGLDSLDDLFEAVPAAVRLGRDLDVGPALDEVTLLRHLGELAGLSKGAGDLTCFAGGGAYDHHVPAAVRALAGRAEFATSYTPYQPELSQGVLQAIFEFQTAVCEIYGMEVANASLYDGASALVEGVNLAARVTKRNRAIVGATVHPHYVEVLRTYTSGLGFEVDIAPYGPDGTVDWSAVDATDAAAIVTAYPNVFGALEDVATASEVAHAAGALSVVVADPTAMGVLESPGAKGADVVCGEGQGIGNALAYGGPYVGLFATKLDLVRQVPGRIAGETLDADGRRAYVLTLQAREQHIRRAKATSNVCTNQTLMAIHAAVHLAWLGPEGLRRLGEVCARNTALAAEKLGAVPGCSIEFDAPRFKELVLRTPMDATELARGLSRRGFLAGPPLGRWFPELSDCLLIAVTEKRTEEEITGLAEAIEKELAG